MRTPVWCPRGGIEPPNFSRMLYQLNYLGTPRREPDGQMRTAVHSGVGSS